MTPVADRVALDIILREVADIEAIVTHCKGFRTVIQAGGNIGIWPVRLAKRFARVITAEPDAANYKALQANTAAYPAIECLQVAFGREPSRGAIEPVDAKNIGAHRVASGNDFDVMRIDDLGVTDCDLLQLDVEGFEFFALQGALKTIEASSPVICLELKRLAEHYGISDSHIRSYLERQGYKEVARIHRDVIFAQS